MAETDPYETSYAEHVPHLSESVSRTAAKRLRKQALGRGERARDEFERKAPNWKNEPTTKAPTSPKGSASEFSPGSYQTGLHYNLRKQGKVV